LSPIVSRMSVMGLAAVFLCGLVACATGPRKSEAERQADKAIADRVESALAADNELYSRHIIVRADSGVIRLSGFVWDPPDVVEAERIAGSVQGVSRVVNALELQRNGIDNSAVSR
jgi:hyperosmotically inducible periplasmic protein